MLLLEVSQIRYLGKIQDNKDLVTKEYVDGRSGVTSVDGQTGDVDLNLATVATSGNYNDLTNKPSFATVTLKTWTSADV